MPQLFLIRLIRVIRGCKFLAFQQFIPEPFHIAHADSESRPTTTRSLDRYVRVLAELCGQTHFPGFCRTRR